MPNGDATCRCDHTRPSHSHVSVPDAPPYSTVTFLRPSNAVAWPDRAPGAADVLINCHEVPSHSQCRAREVNPMTPPYRTSRPRASSAERVKPPLMGGPPVNDRCVQVVPCLLYTSPSPRDS